MSRLIIAVEDLGSKTAIRSFYERLNDSISKLDYYFGKLTDKIL